VAGPSVRLVAPSLAPAAAAVAVAAAAVAVAGAVAGAVAEAAAVAGPGGAGLTAVAGTVQGQAPAVNDWGSE